MPSSQRARDLLFPATLFCRSRNFVKSSAERAHCWTRDAHRARGIAWTLFMRRERGPRLDMELVHGSGKGVGEEESGRRRRARRPETYFRSLLFVPPFVNISLQWRKGGFGGVRQSLACHSYSYLILFTARITDTVLVSFTVYLRRQ